MSAAVESAGLGLYCGKVRPEMVMDVRTEDGMGRGVIPLRTKVRGGGRGLLGGVSGAVVGWSW